MYYQKKNFRKLFRKTFFRFFFKAENRNFQKLDLEERIANSHVLINDQGEIVQIYDKIHLFDAPLGKKSDKIHELFMIRIIHSRESNVKN